MTYESAGKVREELATLMWKISTQLLTMATDDTLVGAVRFEGPSLLTAMCKCSRVHEALEMTQLAVLSQHERFLSFTVICKDK